MPKTKFIIVFTIMLILLSCIITFIFAFKGTPWKRYQVKKEGKAYIKNKYGVEFYDLKVSYNYDRLPTKSGYSVWGCAKKGDKNTGFRVEMLKIGDRDTYIDCYLEMLWQNEVEKELDLYVKQIYGEEVRAGVGVLNSPIKNFNYKADKIPKYNEVRSKVTMRIDIYMNYYFEKKDYNNEIEKAFKIVEFVKEKQYLYIGFQFVYGLRLNEGKVK